MNRDELVASIIKQAREAARARVTELETEGPDHDEECGEQLALGGCCKHYCPTGEHEVL